MVSIFEQTKNSVALIVARMGGEDGQGMIEYGLLVALISIVAIVVITAIGGGLTNNFQSVLNAL